MFFRKHKIEELSVKLTRQDLLARSRILVIDDEEPELINDLRGAGFSVEYQPDITKDRMHLIDRMIYDMIILDFGNVGSSIGPDQGLSLMRHIKRISPATFVFAYTSKGIGTEHADFYLLADGILRKDDGIGDSLEKIEQGLERARSIQNLWKGMLHAAGVEPGSSRDMEWQNTFVRKVRKNKVGEFKDTFLRVASGDGARQVGLLVIDKLIDLGLKAYVGD